MRIQVAVPDEHVTPDVVEPVLEAVTRLNEHMIRTGQAPSSEDLLKMGARWRPEDMGDEHFDHGGTIAQRGWGDCDDWGPVRAATLRATGEDPGARSILVPSGPTTFHAMVQRSNGEVERGQDDISVRAGMRPNAAISGADGSMSVWACDPHDGRIYQGSLLPTVGPLSLHCGPALAVRGCTDVSTGAQLYEARVDLPIQGSRLVHVHAYRRRWPHHRARRRVHGMLPFSMALSHLAGSPHDAVLGALCGAVMAADVCGLTATLDRYKLLCQHRAASGMAPEEVHYAMVNDLYAGLQGEAAAMGLAPEQLAANMMAELAGQGIVRVPTGNLAADVQEIASGVLSACFRGGRPVVGDFFSDVASGLSSVVKPIEQVYNAIPTPVKAVLAPASIVTEYAYAHPESVPMFGSLAAQAKTVFENVMKKGAPVASAVQAAAAAIHPTAVPATHVAPATVLATKPVTPAAPPPPLPKKAIPLRMPIAPPKVVPLAAKPPGAAHAAMPVSPAIPPHPTAAPAPALVMPPGARPAPAAALPRLPGMPTGVTHWHCAPLPGGHWACAWQ